jgi:VCBS repeat-containing protein
VATDVSAQGAEDIVIHGALSATDVESALLHYRSVTQTAHGSVVVHDNGTFDYTPTANYNGPDSFTFRANDGSLDSNVATVSLAVAAVNDAPVNTIPGSINAALYAAVAITGLAVHDVDASSLTTTLHVDQGTLTVAAIGGAVVSGSGSSTVTLHGSVAQIDATLAASNNVLYQSGFKFSGLDHLTVTSSDGGGSGAGGPMSDIDVLDINVLAGKWDGVKSFINSAPSLDTSAHLISDAPYIAPASVGDWTAAYGTKLGFADFHLM